MIINLFKLANTLDKKGYQKIADEIDSLLKKVVEISPQKEQELDKKTEEYFNNPEKQLRNTIEHEYGLDEPDMFGLEPNEWHGFKYSFYGYPKGVDLNVKKYERYHTAIINNESLPEVIDDKAEDGIWELEEVFEKPYGATQGKYQAVYHFIPKMELDRRKERILSPESQKIIDESDTTTTEEV